MKAGLVRISSSYARLLLTLFMGLAVVPLLLGWLGLEAFGIISLLGASVGLAALFRDLTHRSMVRELGAAYHSGDERLFISTYNSAFLLSGAVAVVTALSFGVVLAIFPMLNISAQLRGPAIAFLLWQASHAVLIVLLSPTFNMYLVLHRFVAINFWHVMLRGANLLAAVLLVWVLGVPGRPESLGVYGFVWAMLDNVFLLIAVGILMARDPRLRFRPRHVSRAALRPILGTFGWNTGVQASMAAIERLPPFILNVMVGPIANAIWGIVYRLTSYVRMATIGVQFGADSISAKLSAAGDEASRLRVQRFMTVQTRLNSMVALPVGLAMFALARPLLDVWVGAKVQDPAAILEPAAVMTRILAVAIVTRSVSEGWVTVLYGAGYVSRYAPVIFAGGLLAPLLGVVLTWALPPSVEVQGPALGFTIVVSSVYLLALPIVGARCVGQGYFQMLAPMLRPLLIAAAAAPTLWLGPWLGGALGHGVVGQLVAPAGAFGLVYGPLAFLFALTPEERRRLLAVVDRQRFGRSRIGAPVEP